MSGVEAPKMELFGACFETVLEHVLSFISESEPAYNLRFWMLVERAINESESVLKKAPLL